MLVYRSDHILKLDLRRPAPAVVNDWLPGALPAVHCLHSETHKETL